MLRKLATVFRAALVDFSRNNCPYMAAGIAYWTLFSLFPLVLAAISILGFLYPTSEGQRKLVEAILRIIPVSEEYLASVVGEVVRGRGAIGALSIVGLLWAGTAVFSAIRKGINHAWHIGQPHYFLVERLIDIIMLFGVALLAFILVAFTTNVFGLSTLSSAPDWLSGGLIGKVFMEIGVLAVTFGVFVFLYRYVPNTSVAWQDVWFGALFGAVAFEGVRIGFTWFVSSFGNFNLVYGSLGALMAVLVWSYLSALAVVWGAELCFIYSRIVGTRVSLGLSPELMPKPTTNVSKRRGFIGMLTTVASWLLPPKRRRS